MLRMNNPLVSVVVPVYKAESYLEKCIGSIIDQSYTNLEIILINDGSPDNCGVICESFANRDSRIRYFHQKNSGVSIARNVGIKNAFGDYIIFVDSDDMLTSDAIKNLMQAALSFPEADIIKGNHYALMSSGQLLETKFAAAREQYNSILLENHEFWDKIISLQKNVLVALFKTSMFKDNSILFDDEMRVMEDHLFMIRACNASKYGIYTNSFCYIVSLDNSSSITHNLTKDKIENMLRSIDVVQSYNNELDSYFHKELENDCGLRLYYSVVNTSHLQRFSDIAAISCISRKYKWGGYPRA